MFNLNPKIALKRQRNGISIIEVLTSMAVATIGVFGIMVMIPFAVKQSQSGLDSDAAHNIGRNALEEMQISGLFQVRDDGNFERLVVAAADDGVAFFPPPAQAARTVKRLSIQDFGANHRAPGLFHFDPIGFASGVTNIQFSDPAGVDPGAPIEILAASASRNGNIDLDLNGLIDVDSSSDLPTRFLLLNSPTSISLAARAKIPLTLREADRLCKSSDEMFFEQESAGVEDFGPPQPLYNIDTTTANRVRRQTGGRITWSAFLTPEKDSLLTTAPSTQFRANVLVYRDRFFDPVDPLGSNYALYQTDMNGLGFTQSVNEISLARDGLNYILPDTVSRGDWVMLVNRIAESDGSALREHPPTSGVFHRSADTGYRIQVMFAKVTRVGRLHDGSDGLPATPADSFDTVSIDGGAFDFVVDNIPDPTGIGTNPPSSLTYMIHLKNVVNVFERSVTIE